MKALKKLVLFDEFTEEVDRIQLCLRLSKVLATAFGSPISVSLFGSSVNGFGFKGCDVDLLVEIDHELVTVVPQKDEDLERTYEKKKAQMTDSILRRHPALFKALRCIKQARVPIVKCFDLTSGLHCDLSFKNHMSVLNSYFVSEVFQNPTFHAFAITVRFWAFRHKLAGDTSRRNGMSFSNYALIMMIVFYLQVSENLQSVEKMQEDIDEKSSVINGWECGYDVSKNSVKTSPDLLELLIGFFEYFSRFNYQQDVISPFAGNPVDRKVFQNSKEVHPFMKRYWETVLGFELKHLPVDGSVCIQDPFELNHNVSKGIDILGLINWRKHCSVSAKTLKEEGDKANLVTIFKLNIPAPSKGVKKLDKNVAKLGKQIRMLEKLLKNADKSSKEDLLKQIKKKGEHQSKLRNDLSKMFETQGDATDSDSDDSSSSSSGDSEDDAISQVSQPELASKVIVGMVANDSSKLSSEAPEPMKEDDVIVVDNPVDSLKTVINDKDDDVVFLGEQVNSNSHKEALKVKCSTPKSGNVCSINDVVKRLEEVTNNEGSVGSNMKIDKCMVLPANGCSAVFKTKIEITPSIAAKAMRLDDKALPQPDEFLGFVKPIVNQTLRQILLMDVVLKDLDNQNQLQKGLMFETSRQSLLDMSLSFNEERTTEVKYSCTVKHPVWEGRKNIRKVHHIQGQSFECETAVSYLVLSQLQGDRPPKGAEKVFLKFEILMHALEGCKVCIHFQEPSPEKRAVSVFQFLQAFVPKMVNKQVNSWLKIN